MKKIFALLSLVLCLCFFASCAGTPVIYHMNCDCTTGNQSPAPSVPVPEGGLKTGLSITTSIKDSKSATASAEGKGVYDITVVAVLVDANGVIQDCKIDGIKAEISFNNAGAITADLTKAIETKNELGDRYGMVQYGNAKYEWNVQAQALADFAKGKTAAQLKSGAIDPSTGKAPAGSDLASTATIYLSGPVAAIEKAVANATYLGAKTGDTLCMATTASAASSKNAGAKAGETVLDATVVALTKKGDMITSCAIDAVQAKVNFDTAGTISTDCTKPVETKNELGERYNMVTYGGAIAEWNVQAARFASYVTGKTVAQVEGIAVNESTKPTGDDLKTSVTIAIGDFQKIIKKAAQ